MAVPFRLAAALRRRPSLKEERGSSTVEFALSLLILMSFILGILEFSLAVYSYFFVSEMASEGSRYAAVRGSGCAATPSLCTTATAAGVQSYLQGLNYPAITSSNITVTTTWPDTSGCSPSASPCNNPGNHVVVTVQYQFPLAMPFVPASTLNFTSTSETVITN
jgi:Flp pilus assembly protein TadG